MLNRIENLRKYMQNKGVDAMLISSFSNIHYYSYFVLVSLMQDILLESDIDLLIGTKNIYILYDRINDQLYSVRTRPVGNGDSPIDYRLDFNTITYLG